MDSSKKLIEELEMLRKAGIRITIHHSRRRTGSFDVPAKKAKPTHPSKTKPKPKPKGKHKGSEHKTIRSKTGTVLHGAARHARMKALAKKRGK